MALWLLVAAMLLAAAPAKAEKLTFRSRAYDITTTLDRSLAKQTAEHMDAVHAEYVRRFANFRARNLQQHPLYVFATRQQYLTFLEEHDIDGAGSGGMFFVSPDGSGLATYLEGQGLTRMFRTLRHEGFHQFAHSKIGPNLPQWVNEGLAEYFAESIMVGGRLSAGQVSPAALHNLHNAIDEGDYVPFEQLLNLSSGEWGQRVRSGDSRLLYDQSWSIVHFLVHADRRYVAALEQYLTNVGRGVDSRVAFDQAFQSPDYESFERAWKRYVEDLGPTPETTAAHRLTFLGEGLRLLHQRGIEVDSLDALRENLRAGSFRMQMSLGHGVTLEMHADEDEHFQPPESKRGNDARIELLSADDQSLPPRLVVRGLRHTVGLDWQKGPDGRPVSTILYE